MIELAIQKRPKGRRIAVNDSSIPDIYFFHDITDVVRHICLFLFRLYIFLYVLMLMWVECVI